MSTSPVETSALESDAVNNIPISDDLTGDPFVDVGALVLKHSSADAVMDKIRWACDVYVDVWVGRESTHSI